MISWIIALALACACRVLWLIRRERNRLEIVREMRLRPKLSETRAMRRVMEWRP
jgi:hypothetical protein